MASLTLRVSKGSPLTFAEVDGNFSALNNELAEKAPLASPALTGDPTAPTPATSDNDTSIATTAFVKAQPFAPLASPALTGTPTAPTAATSTNTTQLATTAFVKAQPFAPLASPAFTGTPTAPTPATLDNGTRVATTAWVNANAGRIIQVVEASTTDYALVASTILSDVGLSASITPKATSSKILVIADVAFFIQRNSTNAAGYMAILRGSTDISGPHGTYELTVSLPGSGATSNYSGWRALLMKLDSPNTTASVTYKIQARAETTANNGAAGINTENQRSKLYLLEVLA